MTTELQRQFIQSIEELLSLAPDIRIGQLLAHLGFLGEAHVGHGLGDIDDDELLAIAYRHRAELQTRLRGEGSEAASGLAVDLSVSGTPLSPIGPAPVK